MTVTLTALEASRLLREGDHVFIQGGIGEPGALLAGLARNPVAGANVNFYSVMVPGVNQFTPSTIHPDASLNSFFVYGGLTESFRTGKTRFLPMHYSEIPRYLARLPELDAVLIQACPPDENGMCNLGPTADFVPLLLERKVTVIAELNSAMPPAAGGELIPYSAIDYAVETSHELPVGAHSPSSDVADRIADNVAQLIDDGDTLQFGIGSIPDAVMARLSGHRYLGIHTGMVTENIRPLIDAGVITGERKRIDTGEHVTGFALGTGDFYRWASRCPDLRFRPVSHTHDVRTIAAVGHFVSINSAVEVDLFGQVNVEMLGGKQISATGGALDFIRGARLSHPGKSVIALPATALKGARSRITHRLSEQSFTSIPRTDVDCIVTEYGIASLAHKSVCERAEALINIAAPEFRQTLTDEWQTYMASA